MALLADNGLAAGCHAPTGFVSRPGADEFLRPDRCSAADTSTLTKSGTGTLTLKGNNSYPGATCKPGHFGRGQSHRAGPRGSGHAGPPGATLGLQGDITLAAGEFVTGGDLAAATEATIAISAATILAGTVQAVGQTTFQATGRNLFFDGRST